MSGMKPFFLTGANAKIKVNGVTLAFVTSLSYSVSINHATPRILGMYEPTSVEPLSYMVTGAFSVIRYVADAKDKIGASPNSVSSKGNGIGYWSKNGEDIGKKILKSGSDGGAYENLNPSKLAAGTGFEIEVIQKTSGGQVTAAKIRNARITRADFSIAKNQAAIETFNFTALYLDEDSFIADFSGSGQQFS